MIVDQSTKLDAGEYKRHKSRKAGGIVDACAYHTVSVIG
jgi:hypothetical protein